MIRFAELGRLSHHTLISVGSLNPSNAFLQKQTVYKQNVLTFENSQAGSDARCRAYVDPTTCTATEPVTSLLWFGAGCLVQTVAKVGSRRCDDDRGTAPTDG